MKRFSTPILLILFNRPQFLPKQFNVLSGIKPLDLYISIDGPRQNNIIDIIFCSEVNNKIKELITWDCKCHFQISNSNLGCKNGPISAINWFFNQVEEGIILEDDCLPDISFFHFSAEMLIRYRNNDKITAICGCNYGFSSNRTSYIYSSFMNPWGWATWRRSVNEVSYNLDNWTYNNHKFLHKKIGHGYFDRDKDWFDFWVTIFNSIYNNDFKTAWDYYWIYHIFSKNKFVIIPSKNLVTNLGFGEYATHTTLISHPANNLLTQTLYAPYKGPKRLKNDIIYEKKYVKKICYMHNDLPLSFHLKNYLVSFYPFNYLYKIVTCLRK
jgi:hypothetical protein